MPYLDARLVPRDVHSLCPVSRVPPASASSSRLCPSPAAPRALTMVDIFDGRALS